MPRDRVMEARIWRLWTEEKMCVEDIADEVQMTRRGVGFNLKRLNGGQHPHGTPGRYHAKDKCRCELCKGAFLNRDKRNRTERESGIPLVILSPKRTLHWREWSEDRVE